MIKIIFFTVALHILMASIALSEEVSLSQEEINESEKNPIYQKYELVCNVCNAIESKSHLESALTSDLKYAKKYGVINYGRRDRAIQAIKRDDETITKGKAEYSKRYKRKFNRKECNLVNTEDCEGALFEISAKILGKVPWEIDDVYPKP
ncbi:MAG: hypothetical protein FPO08_04565 [Geobacter sp.]|nr:MAG: hypothetical protein FPO08_04565 [Geobacter sp.]